jgi:hypothetical protein
MTDYPGKRLRRPGELPATTEDLAPSDWDNWDNGAPPVSWVPARPTHTGDKLTMSADELRIRYHETRGRAHIVCGYCEDRYKSRNLQKLLKWFRTHPCIAPYANPPVLIPPWWNSK